MDERGPNETAGREDALDRGALSVICVVVAGGLLTTLIYSLQASSRRAMWRTSITITMPNSATP
jgi:hypothetical protein